MPSFVRVKRPYKVTRVARRQPRPLAVARTLTRSKLVPLCRTMPASLPAGGAWAGFQADPYVDYGRFLTPEGGVLLIYKDIDPRWRHWIWRVFAWSAATGAEAWLLLWHSPVQSLWINIALLILMASINGFIVWKPVELYRRIEIRPDCMIIEGEEVFWLRLMETGWPALSARRGRQSGSVRHLRHALRRISDRPPLRRSRPHARGIRRAPAGSHGAALGRSLTLGRSAAARRPGRPMRSGTAPSGCMMRAGSPRHRHAQAASPPPAARLPSSAAG